MSNEEPKPESNTLKILRAEMQRANEEHSRRLVAEAQVDLLADEIQGMRSFKFERDELALENAELKHQIDARPARTSGDVDARILSLESELNRIKSVLKAI